MTTQKEYQRCLERSQAREKAGQQIMYKEALAKYGIIAFLMVLERFEKEERYELCQLIIDTVKRANLWMRPEFPTKLNKDIIKRVTAEFEKTIGKKVNPNYHVHSENCYNYILKIKPEPRINQCNHFYFDNGDRINFKPL